MSDMTRIEIKDFLEKHYAEFEKGEIPRFERAIAESGVTRAELETFSFKSPTVGLCLSLFLGFLGADRFYAGQFFFGLIKLITNGACGIWWVVDWFMIRKAVKQRNQSRLYAFLQGVSEPTLREKTAGVMGFLKSEQGRNMVKDVVNSGKNFTDSFGNDF